jgi:hypothetical protein
MLWLKAPVAEKDKPSLPKLLQFKVHEKVRANYSFFGTLLLSDDDGSIIEKLRLTASGKFSTSFAGFSLPGSRVGESQ